MIMTSRSRRLTSAAAFALVLSALVTRFAPSLTAQGKTPAPSPMTPTQPFVRDPKIAIDADYTAKIKEYTTEPFFTS